MKNGAIIIGVGGCARVGKDSFAKLVSKSDFVVNNNLKVRNFAFADKLKADTNTFLRENCGIPDINALDSETKNQVRPFLVWYGCYMRIKNPAHWVQVVEKQIIEDWSTDVFTVSDVRFENEAQWVHSLGGKVVHIKRFKPAPEETSLVQPPNAEEAKNDPLVEALADAKVRWPTVSDAKLDSLKRYVDVALADIGLR